MSSLHDNGKTPQPPVPAGYDGTCRDAMPDQQGMIVRSALGATPAPLSPARAALWCIASGICAGISPIFAPFLVGLSYAVAVCSGGMRERAIACACLAVPAAAIALLVRFAGVEDAVFSCVVGIAAAELYLRGKLTPGSSCAAVGILGLLFLASSEAVARMAGTTLYEQLNTVMDIVLAETGQLSIEVQAALQQTRGVVDAIWPAAFAMIVFAQFVLALWGAAAGARRQGVDTGAHEPLEQFDLPLWVVGCLIAGIVGLAASRAVPAFSAVLTVVSGTLICALRLAFATQGFAVLTWFRRTGGWPRIVGLIVTCVALYLEFNLFVLTVVGVLDVWVNLRHLNRGARVTIQDPADNS